MGSGSLGMCARQMNETVSDTLSALVPPFKHSASDSGIALRYHNSIGL